MVLCLIMYCCVSENCTEANRPLNSLIQAQTLVLKLPVDILCAWTL